MTYQPNFTDPRVIKRITKSVGFVCAVFSETKPLPWSTRDIDRHLGSQANEISQWLRSLLLICTQSHWNKDTGECKKYTRNQRGVDYLREQLVGSFTGTFEQYTERSQERPKTSDADASESFVEQNKQNPTDKNQQNTITIIPYCCGSPVLAKSWDSQMVNQWIRREYASELTNKTFGYKDKSSRLWHPLQNVRSEYRRQALSEAGLIHHYDIASAAPTLIYQRAQHLGMDVYCEAIEQLITDKDNIRQTVADLAEITVKDAKIVINALFCGARLGNNKDFAISHLLNHDRARIEVLKQDPYIQQLRTDIKDCWSYITPTLAARYSAETNRRLQVSSKQKWSVYFELERVILDCVRSYLMETNNAHFLEHDGWTTSDPIDIVQLSDHIHKQTGFRLSLSYTHQKE